MMLALRRLGRGHPVVFLGGCPTPWDVLRPLAEAASLTHEAIELALPGYGDSPALTPYTVEAAGAAIEATLVAAGVHACALVGFSGGAYRALAIAVAGRLRVTGVYALAGFCGFGAAEVAGLRGLAELVRSGADLRPLAAARFLSAAFAARNPEAVAEVERWGTSTTSGVLAAELDAFAASRDLTERLRSLRLPVVARVGRADLASPPAKSGALVAACRGARLEVVPGAGHALVYEDLPGTVASLCRWLETLVWTERARPL
jgi:pimeloyl-ACP methyl ester carboxylesterase